MVEKLSDVSTKNRIGRISFRVLSSEQVSQLSVASLENKTLYDITSRRPFSGGPLDLRLGVSTKAGTCATCNENIQNCSGHFGEIKLFLPVYHIGFIRHTLAILNCICKSCGSILLSFNRKLAHGELINLNAVRNECKNAKSCPRCKRPNGTVRKNTGFRIYHEVKSGKDEVFSMEINPQTCLNIFRMIDEDDYQFLGVKESPCNLIIGSLLVPPACIRPSVDMQEEGFNEDDLTVKLSEIINTNKLLEESVKKGNSMPIINEDWDYLQLQVSLFINSDLPSVNMINTPIRGLVQRLKGKAGRFRCNLSGKRVDFSGRTVISPDPNLSIEQVGIPEMIAKVLTVPEKVNSLNKAFLSGLVENGVDKWPGANYVISKDSKGKIFKRFLRYGKSKELKAGDVVERHMLNNDIVLFNRQPSLHRMSIMAHKAKIHKHRTLRFNECDCTPYNADFDGDEMNIHLPQTFEARAEGEELMGVRHNLCTARNGEPLISCTQDFLTGAYLLTGKDIFFSRERFAQLCSYIYDELSFRVLVHPAIVSPIELFTGKQLFEVVISYSLSKLSVPRVPSINFRATNRSYRSEFDMNDGLFEIQSNRYVRGRLDKSIIGSENRKDSLVYQLMKVSKACAVTLMNGISRLTSRYMAETGFSIGLDDVYPGPKLISGKNRIINRGYLQVVQFIESQDTNIEMEISSTLNKIREKCGNICVKELSRFNSPIIMQSCGSKGSKINVSQMIACVGQQIISGRRIPNGMPNRTLPHFPVNCLTPESRGFVMNSFFTGMHGYEFFFHAVSGREGLVDTAVKTAETGYMQRRLMKALEDFSIKYDYTVRNSLEDIVQFRYGEDSVQTLRNEGDEFLEWIFVEAIAGFNREYRLSTTDILSSNATTGKGVSSRIRHDFTGIDFDISKCVEIYFRGAAKEDGHLVSRHVFESLDALRDHPIARDLANRKFAECLAAFLGQKKRHKFFYRGIFYFYLQNMCFIRIFFDLLRAGIMNMIIEPGTAVGAIAGQSIGEPGTQMTLKTFHFAGVASMNITLGVPRLKEIINASANISTPIIKGQLSAKGLESARVVKGRIEKVILQDVVNKIVHSTSPDKMMLSFHVDTDLLSNLGVETCLEAVAGILRMASKGSQVDVSGNAINYSIKRIKENAFFNIERIKKQFLATKISGVETARRVIINRLSALSDEHELLVEGRCLRKVLGMAGIEPYSTLSNDILEVEKILGIEAARSLIIREVEYTMGKHGIKVDHRHIMLLADTMAFRGEILGITRFGIGKMRTSTLMLSSFEQTAEYLFNAAVRGIDECVDGVSESIILGIPISLGTGSIGLYWKTQQ